MLRDLSLARFWRDSVQDCFLQNGRAVELYVTPTVVRAFDLYGQATKGAWGMSWHQEALKGVEDCEKPG